MWPSPENKSLPSFKLPVLKSVVLKPAVLMSSAMLLELLVQEDKRDVSVVKSASCPCRGPELYSQHHLGWLATTYNSESMGSDSLFQILLAFSLTYAQTHKHIYIS